MVSQAEQHTITLLKEISKQYGTSGKDHLMSFSQELFRNDDTVGTVLQRAQLIRNHIKSPLDLPLFQQLQNSSVYQGSQYSADSDFEQVYVYLHTNRTLVHIDRHGDTAPAVKRLITSLVEAFHANEIWQESLTNMNEVSTIVGSTNSADYGHFQQLATHFESNDQHKHPRSWGLPPRHWLSNIDFVCFESALFDNNDAPSVGSTIGLSPYHAGLHFQFYTPRHFTEAPKPALDVPGNGYCGLYAMLAYLTVYHQCWPAFQAELDQTIDQLTNCARLSPFTKAHIANDFARYNAQIHVPNSIVPHHLFREQTRCAEFNHLANQYFAVMTEISATIEQFKDLSANLSTAVISDYEKHQQALRLSNQLRLFKDTLNDAIESKMTLQHPLPSDVADLLKITNSIQDKLSELAVLAQNNHDVMTSVHPLLQLISKIQHWLQTLFSTLQTYQLSVPKLSQLAAAMPADHHRPQEITCR